MPASLRRILTSLAAWLVGAGVAVAVGVLALSLINSGFASGAVQPVPEDGPILTAPSPSPSPPDSPADSPSPGPSPSTPPAARTAPVAPSPSPSASGSPAPSGTGGPLRQLASSGGTAIARCTDADAYLVSWSPAQGFEVDEVHRGPARVVAVSFVAPDQKVWLAVHCVAGIPERDYDWRHDD